MRNPAGGLVDFVARGLAAQTAVDRRLEAGGALRSEKRSPARAGSLVRQVGRATARLWKGLSYDEAIAVANEARHQLGLERPQERKRIVTRLTRPELEQLLAHAYRVRGYSDAGLLVKTLVLTGCRVSEFVALDVEDLNHTDAEITVRKGKGRKPRVVPILPALADELRTYVRHRTAGPLFRGRTWERFSQRRVQQIVKELAAGAGLTKRVYPHLLRHTVAQHLLEGGMSLEQVQRFLGHSRITTTQIYAESSAASIRDSYRKALR
jgi:integrase/recombinase XerD